MTDQQESYMKRALELAELGRGSVSPNPMVGCVIVHNDQIIGEGWHRKYGEAHAEVNAVNSVADQSLLKESTVYVTLEPCSHHGKTPPCANMLVSKGVKKVVVGASDSNPLVAGKGIEILNNGGIETVQGILSDQARDQNARFFTSIEKQRPYVILKWAQTTDGFVARENYDSKWISNAQSRSLVHQWRAEEDAILVGKNTAKYDDPKLNVRSWAGKDPLRLVIDMNLELDSGLNLFNGEIPTVVYNTIKSEERDNLAYAQIDSSNMVNEILKDLYQRKIQSVIIEGGSATLNSFINEDLWDEARVFTSQTEFGTGIKAPTIQGKLISEADIAGDRLHIYLSKTSL